MTSTFLSSLCGGTLLHVINQLKGTSSGITKNTSGGEKGEEISWFEFESVIAANRVKAKVQWQDLQQVVADAVMDQMVSQ
jgi:hypothetical protein